MATVPLRRILRNRGHHLGEKGFVVGAAGWGLLVGGTSGAGVVLISLLLAAGLEGSAVIATDSAISIVTGVVKIGVFAFAGVLTPTVIVIALLMLSAFLAPLSPSSWCSGCRCMLTLRSSMAS